MLTVEFKDKLEKFAVGVNFYLGFYFRALRNEFRSEGFAKIFDWLRIRFWDTKCQRNW